MQEHPVLVRLDLGRHFAQGEDHGAGLGRGEGRVGEGGRAEGMVEDVSSARPQESRGVGQERRGRGAVTLEVMLHRLDSVCAMPSCAVEVFRHVLGCRRLPGRHNQTRLIARGHAFRCDDHPPWLSPRGRGRGECVIDAAAEGRLLALDVHFVNALIGFQGLS